MSAAPASDGAVGRRIGDILLEHGFVNESQLAAATEEQERTKQPLGQILVQHGAITRLELASALAEQWSDPSASITVLPRPTGTSRPAAQTQPHDDAQYAARLQEAVADLARRVQANEPLEGIDERINDLGQRTEATLARTQRLEATVATLVERLEGVTDGVEEAFAAFQGGTAGLAADVARIDATVAEIAAAPVEREHEQASNEELVELRAVVARLEGRPDGLAAFEALREAVDELAQRPVDAPELEARLAQLEALVEQWVDGGEGGSSPEVVDELRRAVARLEERPDGVAAVEGRLEELAARLDQMVDPAAVESLRQAVDELAARPPEHPDLDSRLDRLHEVADGKADAAALEAAAGRLDEIADVLAELRARPEGDPELDARLAAIEARLEAVAATAASPDPAIIDEVVESVERAAATQARLAESVAAVGARIDELAAQVPRVDEAVSRVDGLEGTIAASVDALRVELVGSVTEALDGVRASVFGDLEELRLRVEEASQTAGEGAESPAVAALSERLDDLAHRIQDGSPEPDARVEDLLRAFDALESEIADLRSRPEMHELSHDRIEALAAQIEDLGERRQVDDVAGRLETVERQREADAETIDVLLLALDRIREELSARQQEPPAQAAPDPVVEGRLAELASLQPRLDEMERDLNARIDEVAARGPTHHDAPAVAEQLERVRLSIERFGLHLGEHDRAIADLTAQRGLEQRLDELAARVESLAAGEAHSSGPARAAAAAPDDMLSIIRRVEEAEAASQADREKLMSRLERMGSSIDWRLQRLEATDQE